jgi:hypothetical protein
MSRRILGPLPRPVPLIAGGAITAGNESARQGSPGFRPVIVRPQMARHGGGGGGHGGGGHGGHHQGSVGGSGPGYLGGGGGGKADWKAILASLAVLSLFLVCLVLIAVHEYAAIVILMAVVFGVPLAGFILLVLLVLVAKVLPRRKRSSRAN